MIATMYRGGLRLSEALTLKAKDVDVFEDPMTVLHAKGAKRRVVAIDAAAMALVERWLIERRALDISRRSTLFCTLNGKPVKPSYVRTVLPRLAKRAGIDKRVHPHGLRPQWPTNS